jgi:hypothetical protein
LGFEVIPPIESTTLAILIWVVAGIWTVYLLLPKLRGSWSWVKRWWPLALARTVRQLKAQLREAHDRNEQLDQLNKNLEVECNQLSELLQETKRENSKLKQERDEFKTGQAASEVGLPADAKTQQEFVERYFRLIDLLKLAGEDATIEDKTFRDCIIEGPAVVTSKSKPLQGDRPRGRGVTIRAIVKRHDTSYIYGEPDSIFYEVPSGGEKASGVIRLVGCDFIGTKLKDIAVVGTKEELRDWKSEFNYRGKYGE